MIIEGLIYSNQHENKWCFAAKKTAGVYRFKLHSVLDNTSPNFFMVRKNTIIHELRAFRCDIYPVTSLPKSLGGRKQERSFICSTNSRATIKLLDPHNKKLKYCSSAKFDEHNSKFEKVWSPGSEIKTGTNVSTLPTLKLIPYDIRLSNMVYV